MRSAGTAGWITGGLCLGFAACLSACSPANDSEAEATARLRAELDAAEAAQKAGDEAYRASVGQPEGVRLAAKANATMAARLNLDGHVCADVVTASRLSGTDDSVVTCLEALFGDRTVSYRIDARTGEATRL